MADDRIRSMVPLFGGGDNYVDTLDRTLQFIASTEPDHDSLINWHRTEFANVQSQTSIERRLSYLENVGFIRERETGWQLDTVGERYFETHSQEALFDIMADRNVGLESLLLELAERSMTIEEVNEFLLATNEVLGWNPTKTDMSKQRVNWLRSLDLITQEDDGYTVTAMGQQFVDELDSIRTIWAEMESAPGSEPSREYTATEYQSVSASRYLDPEFRAVVLYRHDTTCPVSTVDHPALLDVAHVLPWSDYPEHRADFGNVLPLSKTHHAAFDNEFFTLDTDYRLQVDPEFETDSDILQRTLLDRTGDKLDLQRTSLSSEFLEIRNEALPWY